MIGVAAREGAPIRIGHVAIDYSYGAAIRDRARSVGMDWSEATEIPYPGLPAPESQIALPILSGRSVVGVLFAESTRSLCFRYDDEDALSLVADRLATLIPQALSGLALVVALWAALAGIGAVTVVAALTASLVAHLVYLVRALGAR